MSSTHTSIHIHGTFSTKNRLPLIDREWRNRLHEYLGGSLRGLSAKPLEIGGVADHVHLLFGIKPTQCVSDVIRELKKASTAWVRGAIGDRKFGWQEGYGAFAISRLNVKEVSEYIRNQEAHHRRRTFQEEYQTFLESNGIEYDERYLW